MKIRLFVNGEPFIIDMCEGVPEIRREDAAKSTADRRITVSLFRAELAQTITALGGDPYASLRVESVS